MRLQRNDRSFFHLMDIDDDGKLRNVMCINLRSKAAYKASFATEHVEMRLNTFTYVVEKMAFRAFELKPT